MSTIATIHFQQHADVNGVLCVYESGRQVPFEIRRVFTVSARKGDIRGDHAHKQCQQLLICVSGKIRVSCDDGSVVTEYNLDNLGAGLLVPPGIWAKEEYLTEAAVLMVLCDRNYEFDDYIRDYEEFKCFLGDKEL